MFRTLPRGLRRAGVVALVTLVAGAGALYQLNVRGARAPEFTRGGAFGRVTEDATPRPSTPAPGSPSPTATGTPDTGVEPSPSGPTADGDDDPSPAAASVAGAEATPRPEPGTDHEAASAPRPDEAPRLGTYVYAVDGWERVTGFGRRGYPEEMTLAAHRDADDLAPDEVVFDLDFSANHEEREVVAYRSDGVAFTYEAGSVTFGPMTQTSEATYHPPMVQTPLPLEVGASRSGTTEARNPDGQVVRTEDWTVETQRTERIEVMGEEVDTWVVHIERQTREGSSEQVHRERTYWFDPGRSMWVKWHEHMRGERQFGPGTFTYETDYTATLEEFQAG